MFGSSHSAHRPSSRAPSLLSLARKNEQQPQPSMSQSSSPDSLNARLEGMGLSSPQMSSPARSGSSFTSTSTASSSARKRPNGLIQHRHRKHMYEDVHKAKVKERLKRTRADFFLHAYENHKRHGYQSSKADFDGYLTFRDHLRTIVPPEPRKVDDGPIRRALFAAQASMKERLPFRMDTVALDNLQNKWRQKDAQLEESLKPKIPPVPKSLPPSDEIAVQRLLEKRGTIAKFARETVEDKDIVRLGPGQWLNDEIINFYGAMILSRSEGSKENVPKVNGKLLGGAMKGRGTPLNVHYFSSFFWAKLTGDGYDKGRLAKWTKKTDIFSKDVILIPANHSNAHWTAGAINFRRKRIESYDSMGMVKGVVFEQLRKYLDAEHRNKKKAPFDFTGWEDYASDEITPQQENGYDCGVFTCSFLEALSRGEESFRFTQQDMPYMRRRMIWEIGHAKLRDD